MNVSMDLTELIARINRILPQTQCGQCRFRNCQGYAEAIAAGTADINQCPPGGDEGINELAELLNVPVKPLNPAFGMHKPAAVAFIIEEECIGCTKCIAACPVDAIIGASKFMHTVIASECTGCELCVTPCPVDCIIMQTPSPSDKAVSRQEKSALAKRRYDARCKRLAQEALAKAEKAKQKKLALLAMQKAKK